MNVDILRALRNTRRRCLAVGFLAAASIGAAAVAGVVPATFHGTWVPAKAACRTRARRS